MPKIVSSDEAVPSNVQHDKPCGDCPWRRKAVAGWLGGLTLEQWVLEAQSDMQIACHTVRGTPQPQCAGAAIYRSNTCKSPRDPKALRLPSDRTNVFSSSAEFMEHHKQSTNKRRP